MLGTIILIILLGVTIGFTVYCIITKSYQKKKKGILQVALFSLFSILAFINVIQWSFRWTMLFAILLIQAMIGLWYLIHKKEKKEKPYRTKRVVLLGINNCVLIIFSILPAILFPQFRLITPSGNLEIKTVSYTLTDPVRLESNIDQNENRKVTIQFWYPDNELKQYPLVVFSHGSFGFRGSNYSTFAELASNGYVVCSIDHTYQSFFTKQTDGNVVIANMDFINEATSLQNGDYEEEKEYKLAHDWLDLRLADTNFVLNDILNKCSQSDSDKVYQLIDSDKIGLFGHSLGGATAAQLGRERIDIDAVVVVDGTMVGEVTGIEDGKNILNKSPYLIPILNIYNEEHYKEALDNSSIYANMVATNNAVDARHVVIKGSGHLNFTDLPMFSPYLAKLLGTGEVDSRYCIETMNQIILEYFNHYLKDTKNLSLGDEY